jgi:hypothetical protein
MISIGIPDKRKCTGIPRSKMESPQLAFIGHEALLLLPMEAIRSDPRRGQIVAVAMTMSMSRSTGVMHLAQRAKRDPAAETDNSDTGRGVDHIAEPCGERDSGHPHHNTDQQSRHNVADAGLE